MKFNKAVDKTTAEDETLYFVRLSTDATANTVSSLDPTASAKVQADGKTVVITVSNNIEANFGLASGAVFEFTVDGVKAANGDKFPKYSATLKVDDQVAPQLLTASAKAASTTNKVTLNFTEPVDWSTTGVFKVGGQIATPSAGSTPTEVVLTTAQNLTAGQSYDVEITNLKDIAGNLITPNPVTKTFTVTSDATAQGVKSVTVKGDDTVEIEFYEDMDPATIVGPISSTSNIRLVDAATNNISNASIAQKDSSTSTYVLTLASGTNAFANSNTANLSLVFTDNVKDAQGNKITPETRSFTITKDTVKPQIVSATVVKANGSYNGTTYPSGALVLQLSEEVKALAGNNLDRDYITVIDQDGTDVTTALFNADPIANVVRKTGDNSVVIIPFAQAPASTLETATVRIAAGAFTDDSIGANASEAKVLSGVDFKNATGGTADTTKPTISNLAGAVNTNPVTGLQYNTISFDVTDAADNFDKATALNLDNYRLDGKPLPAGSYVTISTNTASNPDVHTVTITLPAGSISKTQNYAFSIVGLKDKAGNVANTFAVNNLSLTDDVQPEFTAAALNTDGSVTLTFSENLQVAGATAPVPADFEVTLNGKLLQTGASTAYSITPITAGAEAGKFALTVSTSYEAGATVGGSTLNVLYIDVNANGSYTDGTDIVVASHATNTFTPGTYNLNNATSLKIKTVTTPSAADADSNLLKGGKEITVK